MTPRIDLGGAVFGRLTAIEDVGSLLARQYGATSRDGMTGKSSRDAYESLG